MSDYKYNKQDTKDVIELLRGIANDLEDKQPTFTYQHLRIIAYSMVQHVLPNISVDLNDFTDDMEISIGWNRQLEINAGQIDLDDFHDEISTALYDIPDETIQTYIDNINEDV